MNIKIKYHDIQDAWKPGKKNTNLPIFLVQESYPDDLFNLRAGGGIHSGRHLCRSGDGRTPDPDLPGGKAWKRSKCRNDVSTILSRIPKEKGLVVLSEQPGYAVSKNILIKRSTKRQQLIIARMGYHSRRGQRPDMANVTAVFVPGHSEPIYIEQISLSLEDRSRNAVAGEDLHILKTRRGKVAILNCHDFTHAGLMNALQRVKPKIVVVCTFNPAAELFNVYAAGDMHRLFTTIIISNIANYGGSAIHMPIRKEMRRGKNLYTYGGVLAKASGPVVAYLEAAYPTAILRRMRKVMREEGDVDHKREALNKLSRVKGKSHSQDPQLGILPYMPPEPFLFKSQPPYRTHLKRTSVVETVYVRKDDCRILRDGEVSIGVANLESMSVEEYYLSHYHISKSLGHSAFQAGLKRHLRLLDDTLDYSREKLHFLVYPEVFLPLGFQSGDLTQFAEKHGTIIIGGLEYDPPEPTCRPEHLVGLNRCRVLIPNTAGHTTYDYNKLTRSQYDARLTPIDPKAIPGSFKMKLGERLLRFEVECLASFAVLICYDYSHFDILYKLNTATEVNHIPEIVFVVAHNPDATLYRNYCQSDSHRFYQYIVMCNVAKYGESGIFGPIRGKTGAQTLSISGKNTPLIFITRANIAQLRRARELPDGDPNIPEFFQKKPGILTGSCCVARPLT